ncbi:capsular polysaccharide export protein, LipB/KpsS family [Schauerella aestuarii]|uniref:capsular polysaccharide export protein, LipB/KpsS family n=1 Tax=Schauerella aestuarii TaxID=2511204 RepID=UPI00136BBC8A|nr:glycosyltransferase [Achromobacter aestuarii]MYZ45493.1 glycosyltransferase [Achromobacter aestuarii]
MTIPVATLIEAEPSSHISPHDITVCVAVRVTNYTPWILPRLKRILSRYDPSPRFLVVDFGSDNNYRSQIEALCNKNDCSYFFVEDSGLFSASRARNIAARRIKTEYIFFTDVDFIFGSNIFLTICQLANQLKISSYPRRMLTMPIYHIGKIATERLETISDVSETDAILSELCYSCSHAAFDGELEYVAPYSNAFLITRSFFELSGGYSENFRGHGSEDFEYQIRLAMLSSDIPLPVELSADLYGPRTTSFFQRSTYAGFRAYLEAFTAPCERLGLRAYHLWHERPSSQGYWTSNNDWKRNAFKALVARYSSNKHMLLTVDDLPREKTAICLLKDLSHWAYFLPLRLRGYRLQMVLSTSSKLVSDRLKETIPDADLVAIFNPYMVSHRVFLPVIELARSTGVEVMIVERGGLPNSIYYAKDVVYNDSSYKNIDSVISEIDDESRSKARKLIDVLIGGDFSLEDCDDYEVTLDELAIRPIAKRHILIPLQLSEDMAVNKFTSSYCSYQSFVDDIDTVASKYPQYVFVVKSHPLSKDSSKFQSKNIEIISSGANPHAIIEASDYVVTYNSGMGLLALLHGKTTFTIGNSYYSGASGLANKCVDLDKAIASIEKRTAIPTSMTSVECFIAWLIRDKYSFFIAKDVIEKGAGRDIHRYADISVERFVWDGSADNCGSGLKSNRRFSHKSYGARKGMLASADGAEQILTKVIDPRTHSLMVRFIQLLFECFLTEREKKKINRDPVRFFLDSKSRISSLFSRIYISKIKAS